MDPPSPESVTSWRIGELERGFKELRGDLKEAVGTLGGGMTALQTQLSSYQTGMSDKYVPRRDFDELVKRVEAQSEWGWKAASLLLSGAAALFTLIGALAGWMHPLH